MELAFVAYIPVYKRKWIFLWACNIYLFSLFYCFVTLSHNRKERKGIVKESESLFSWALQKAIAYVKVLY